jgi:hypothetical protein
MKVNVTLELKYGPYPGRNPVPEDFDELLDALERAARGQPLNGHDQILVTDVGGIIRAVQQAVRTKVKPIVPMWRWEEEFKEISKEGKQKDPHNEDDGQG